MTQQAPDRPEQPVPEDAQASGNRPAAPEDAAAATGGTDDELARRLSEAEARAAELQDQLLRAAAEAENVRRRAREDVAKAHKYGIEAFAESLLPVKDSLEMALKAETPTVENMREGVEATLRLLVSSFEKHRLLEIDPQGQKFDPNCHQAISTVPATSVQPPLAPNHVAHVLQKGYLIADRVLRPVLVTVVQD
ncbi:MAG: nucleotide exchange factor GrpE [Burkholderiaceae bacterium]|nr:nucleotide exchange factor GrpE [Burkholderiaceae bacterium]